MEKMLWVHAQRAKDSVALFWQSLEGIISARTERLSIGVGQRHPVTNRKTNMNGLVNEASVLAAVPGRAQCSAAE